MNLNQKLKCVLGCLAFVPTLSFGQQYAYTVDLANVSDDQVKVTLRTNPIPGKVVFNMPEMVPGTYEVYDFGRFLTQFEAKDAAGNVLTVEHPDQNRWEIADGSKLSEISYRVNDTWDAVGEGEFVFQPGGSNIEAEENFFINNHCFFGYFEGMKNQKFEVTFLKPAGFFGASALKNVSRTADREVFAAESYFDLIDSPLMFCEPDTAIINVGGVGVLIAIYSPDHEITAAEVAEEVKPILEAQAQYLGGKLPVDHYAFIMYMFNGFAFSYGALEHNFSSMYFLPESSREELGKTLRDFSAHEFFHVVTPLSIHSEQIHDFDFMNPVMSRHLWLYEGVTEYSAGHVQVMYELITIDEYFEMVREKIMGHLGYNDTIPFTVMSQGVLDVYKDEYPNVYQKGALIGLCLDIQLRHYSKGAYGIQNLMKDLSAKFGKDKPFEDAALFQVIEELTYPEIGAFLRRYVGGGEPLPLIEIFALAGVDYKPEAIIRRISLGGVGLDVNDNNEVFVDGTRFLDKFGKTIGYKTGDVIITFNGVAVNGDNFREVVVAWFESHEEGDEFELLVNRKGKKKKGKDVELKTVYQKVDEEVTHYLGILDGITDEQRATLKSWLGERIFDTE